MLSTVWRRPSNPACYGEQPAQPDTGGEVVERTSATSWALAGIGIVTVMSGVGLHLSAASTAEDIDRSDRVKYDRDVDLIESRERLAWTCYGVGAALGIAAAFLMPDKPAVSLSVSAEWTHGVGMAV